MSRDRRSLPRRRAVKRKAEDGEPASQEDEETSLDSKKAEFEEEEESVPLLSYRWIDEGVALPNGQINHQLLEAVVNGKTSIVSVGDTILLRSSDQMDEDEAFVAKVERMWQAPVRKNQIKEHCMKVRARWYFKKMDVRTLRGAFNGPVTKQQLLSTMTDRDLILSNQYDDNDVLTLLNKCTVINRRPSAEDKPTTPLPPRLWVSRYSISFGETPGTSFLTAYEGENQPFPSNDPPAPSPSPAPAPAPAEKVQKKAEDHVGGVTEEPLTQPPAKRYRSDDGEETDETDDTTSMNGQDKHLSEGPNNKGKIVVGPEHQAVVPPFTEGQRVQSRSPQLVWSAGRATDIDAYLEAAAKMLVEYLEQNNLLAEDPYFPLPHERMEKLLEETQRTSMTLSHLSTGSSMTAKRNNLTRECRLDVLLATLHEMEYDVEDALEEVKASPQNYVISWTQEERALFDCGFRRYSGSLRLIASRALMTKSFKEVVDYYYRFKIPDQFRRYQDKKREHAVRMMEIIENRRTEQTLIPTRDDNGRNTNSDLPTSKSSDWTRTSITDVVSVVDDRRISAKDLLFDIQRAVGSTKLGVICKAIKTLSQRSVPELKTRVEEILQNHPALLNRFLEYLPKKFRM